MSKIIESTLEIKNSANDLFEFVSNMENLPLWSNFKSVELVSGEGEVGSKYNLVNDTLLKGTRKTPVEVTVKDSPSHFAYRDESVSAENQIGYKFENSADGKTKATAYREVDMGPIASVLTLNFLADGTAKKELEKSLNRLKEYMEKDLPEPEVEPQQEP
jgi:uncharacterized membrane protein